MEVIWHRRRERRLDSGSSSCDHCLRQCRVALTAMAYRARRPLLRTCHCLCLISFGLSRVPTRVCWMIR